jgi:uncharacterized protein (TIGR03790 family)
MRTSRFVFLFFLLIVRSVCGDESLAAETIVVYNKAAPDSAELAKFYAQQRGIARDHLVGLTCSTNEEITRDEYDATIAIPLRETFKSRHWWQMRENAQHEEAVMTTAIRFVAVIKGVPLKIRPVTGPYPGDKLGGAPVGDRNDAAVDSEIAVLGLFSPQISGAMLNTYFKSFEPIREFESPALLLVCRLDAPTAPMVRRMIVDAIAAEKNGLWGRAYVDGGAHNGGNAGLIIGDQWLDEIARQLHKVGVPVVSENTTAIFPDGYPMTDCALYYGWYAPNIAGPFNQPDFHFVKGAIAVHIHSFSAQTLRDPNANWVGPLIARGAAASVGNVYEPYLQLTSHLDILNDHLLHGFTFAESVYASIEGLSWMTVAVGDPLYRPYASWMQLEASRESSKTTNPWKMYHEFAIKNFGNDQYRQLARQAASRAQNCPMLEDLGSMEAGEGNALATSYFQQARTCYRTRDDLLRVVIEECAAWVKQNKPKRALELVRSVLRVVSDAPATPLLKQIERELTATPPAPVAAPSASPRIR